MKKEFLTSLGLGMSVTQRIMRDGNILFVESPVYCLELCLMTRSFSSVHIFYINLKISVVYHIIHSTNISMFFSSLVIIISLRFLNDCFVFFPLHFRLYKNLSKFTNSVFIMKLLLRLYLTTCYSGILSSYFAFPRRMCGNIELFFSSS